MTGNRVAQTRCHQNWTGFVCDEMVEIAEADLEAFDDGDFRPVCEGCTEAERIRDGWDPDLFPRHRMIYF